MILRCVSWNIFLCLALGPTLKAQITVDDQGYQNVLISFAPNVPSKNAKELVHSIQNLLESTSSVLHKAIGIRIASATFLLPPSWSTETLKDITVTPAFPEQIDRRSDLWVDGTEDSPFGKQPVALQHGGCGVPGHQIILPLNFTLQDSKYPKGKLLVREWLKYRYGVFEENGFTGDKMYPSIYRLPGKPENKITECTNSKVNYVIKKPITDEVCNMNYDDDFNTCRTYPDEKSAANVTSSLMYFHEDLPNMEYICGKDDHPHHSLAQNKQNALCNGQSIWEVVKTSEDFKKTQQQAVQKSIKFSYIQEKKPRIVVLLEDSEYLLEEDIPSTIKFALRRFYYDLPPKSKLAIYTYDSDVKGYLPYEELPDHKRDDLGNLDDFGVPERNIQPSRALFQAAEILFLDSEVEKSFIFLITASPLDKVPEFPEKLRESGICLNVLRFTSEDHPDDESYLPLANSFRCPLYYETIKMSFEAMDIYSTLSRFLGNPVPNFNDDFEIKTVATGSMSAELPVTIPRDGAASLYTLWLGRTLGMGSVECKAGETVVKLRPDRDIVSATDIASFTFDPVDDNITCKLVSAKLPPILTEVQMRTTQKGLNFEFDTWIHDKSTETEQLPITIYAKIYFSGYPVKKANVTTIVTKGNREETVIMLDNGRDPDVTEFDGIYSGYFTGFLEKGDYQISVKVHDNEGEAKIGKDANSSVTDTCCGSTVKSQDYDVPAFSMDKVSTYTAKNKRPEDGYPPSKIFDLQVTVIKLYKNVIVFWTPPEGGKDYVIKLFKSREDAVSKFDATGQEINTTVIGKGGIRKVDLIYLPCENLEEDVTYFMAIRSLNEFNKTSETSNVVEFLPKQKEVTSEKENDASSTTVGTTDGGITNPDPTKNSNNTGAIVLGILGGIAALCALAYLGYYFFVKKPRRNRRDMKEETGMESRT